MLNNSLILLPNIYSHMVVGMIPEPDEPDDLFFYDRVLSGPAKVRFLEDGAGNLQRA